MAPFFTGITRGLGGFGFGKSVGPKEYVLFGGTSGTIIVPSTATTVKIAGCGGGDNGSTSPGPIFGGCAGSGGAASNIVGNTYPLSGVTSLYYQVGDSAQDTFVKQNSSGGADIIRLVAGSGLTGGPATGGGPNAVAGGNGGPAPGRYGSGVSGGASPSPGGCGGGGSGGGFTNNGMPGTPGGSGGAFTGNPNAITKLGVGPAPNSWSFSNVPVTSPSVLASGTTQGTSFSYAFGGISYIDGPGGGGGRGGSAGVGIQYVDPSSPENGNYFGGGGGGNGYPGGAGAYPSTNARQGGKGILVIQLY